MLFYKNNRWEIRRDKEPKSKNGTDKLHISSRLVSSYVFLMKIPQSDSVTFLLHLVRRYVILVCLLTVRDKLDHSVKAVSAKFIHHEVTIFSTEISK